MPTKWEDFTAVDEPKTNAVDWSQFEPYEEPENFKVIDSGAAIKEPSIPRSPELSTIYGGPRKSLPDTAQVQAALMGETLPEAHEFMTRPAVPIPKFEVTKESSVPGAILKSAANLGLSIPEFLETPAGAMAAILAPAAPLAASLGFTGLGAHGLSEASTEAGSQWDELSTPEKVAAGMNIGGAALMTALPAAHAAGTIKARISPKPIPSEFTISGRSLQTPEGAKPLTEGEANAIPERGATPLPVEVPPASSKAVGARISGAEEPAVPQVPVEAATPVEATPATEGALTHTIESVNKAMIQGVKVGEIMGIKKFWQVDYTDPNGEQINFVVKAGSSPDEILNRVVEKQDEFKGTQPMSKTVADQVAAEKPTPLTAEELAAENAAIQEGAPAEEPKSQSDYDRYQELVKSLKGKTLDQAQAIQKELETIKNRNGGMPPKPAEGGGIGGGLKAALEKNKNNEGGFVNLDGAIEFGRNVFDKVKDFAAWGTELVKRAGEWIKPHLQELWQYVRNEHPEQIAKDTGLSFKKNEMPAVNMAGMPPEMVAQFQAQFKPQWEFTDRRPDSPTAGMTFYTPENASRAEVIKRMREKTAEWTGKPTGDVTQLHAGIPIPIKQGIDKLNRMRKAMAVRMKARPTRHIMDQTIDAADNQANITGKQLGNRVKIGLNDVQDRAASVLIAAQFDRANLADLLAKSIAGHHAEAEAAVRYAMAHWNAVEPAAQRGKAIFDNQVARENANGINTQYAEGYLPGIYDMDLMMGSGRPFVIGGKGGGVGTSFKKGKSYATPFDAIADGYKPESLKLSDLVEHRVKAGEKLVNRVEWADSLRGINDPTDGKPIVTALVKHSRGAGQPGWEAAPMGYERRTIIPGMDVAFHEGYSKLFDALTGRGGIHNFEPGGLPAGTIALEAAGAIKHGTLLFDTYHASRVAQKQMFLLKQLPSYKKGLSILEYTDADLTRAQAAGEITPEIAAFARANRGTANKLLKAGLNVGRIQEALYTSVARKIPIIGTFNKWVFEKMTRGAMLESGLIEFDRIKQNNPTWTDTQVANKVSRDLNALFGNLGRQGVFKGQGFQDAMRLVGLAPQWVEAMGRSELGGYKQLTIDPIRQKKLVTGTLGAGLANGLVAYFVGTQLLNLVTRGQLTFQNPEKDHKLDAWIPDVTGKTGGYFISPMAVVAELSHDMMKYMKTDEDVFSAVGHILSNKSSSIWKAGSVLLSGRDWRDQKIVGAWNRIKAAGIALAPVPIPASTIVKGGQPGQTQQQVMASAGFKTERAQTPTQQIFTSAQQWMKESPNPKIRAAWEQRQKETFPESKYKPLKTALQVKDLEEARKFASEIVNKETTPKDRVKAENDILKAFDPFTEIKKGPDKGSVRTKVFLTGKGDFEQAYKKSMSADDRALYQQAIRDKIATYRALTQAIYGTPRNPPLLQQSGFK